MPTFWHGTRLADATAMVGPTGGPGTIDVSRGSGEFGLGFYTQDSRPNALTWVQNRFPANQGPCILELSIDDQAYDALNKRELTTVKEARRMERRLRPIGTEGVDVITGPLNGSRWIEQQKFESGNSEALLNGPDTQRRVV